MERNRSSSPWSLLFTECPFVAFPSANCRLAYLANTAWRPKCSHSWLSASCVPLFACGFLALLLLALRCSQQTVVSSRLESRVDWPALTVLLAAVAFERAARIARWFRFGIGGEQEHESELAAGSSENTLIRAFEPIESTCLPVVQSYAAGHCCCCSLSLCVCNLASADFRWQYSQRTDCVNRRRQRRQGRAEPMTAKLLLALLCCCCCHVCVQFAVGLLHTNRRTLFSTQATLGMPTNGAQ